MGEIVRPVAAVGTLGASELTRDKPFQPGGGDASPLEAIPGAAQFFALDKFLTPRAPDLVTTASLPASSSLAAESDFESRERARRSAERIDRGANATSILTAEADPTGRKRKTLLGE